MTRPSAFKQLTVCTAADLEELTTALTTDSIVPLTADTGSGLVGALTECGEGPRASPIE